MAVQGAKKQAGESKELTQLRKKADDGDAVAQNRMGDLYWDGHGVERDHEEAMKWFALAAEQGNMEAEYSMGYAYLSGQGVEKDVGQGAEWLTLAADKGHAKSQRQLAQLLFSGIGGVEHDPERAVKYWTKAAQGGDVIAQGILGKLYGIGIPGIEVDAERAFGWLTKAAEGGDPDSMHLLGEAYEKGLGCEADEKKAMLWYGQAEARGYVSAESFHLKAVSFFKQKQMDKAYECFRQAAQRKHPVASGNLARLLYYGRGVEQDFNAALHWAEQAVKLGESDAAQVAGMCHEFGHGTPADHQLAQQWYLYCLQGTEEDNMKASCMDALGRCAYKGSHHDYVQNKVPEDYSQAAYWWARAAELGVKDSMCRLAKLHARGRGVKKDLERARQLWTEAASKGSEEAAESLRELGGYSLKERLEVNVPTLVVVLLLIAICVYFGVQYHEMSKDSWFVKSAGDHAATDDTPPPPPPPPAS